MAPRAEEYVVEFGILVRQRRKARNWSQETLAQEAFSNVDRKGHISSIENGKVPKITRDTVRKVARALQIDPEEIPPPLRWPEATEVVRDTNTLVQVMNQNVEELLRRTANAEGVPMGALRAILNVMGEATDTLDAGTIEEKLRAKAVEFGALTERLNRFSNSDPQVQRLRQAAAAALSEGQFAQADAHLASAETRDLLALKDLEVSCCRFDGHRDWVFHEAGGGSCSDGSLAGSLRSRRSGW